METTKDEEGNIVPSGNVLGEYEFQATTHRSACKAATIWLNKQNIPSSFESVYRSVAPRRNWTILTDNFLDNKWLKFTSFGFLVVVPLLNFYENDVVFLKKLSTDIPAKGVSAIKEIARDKEGEKIIVEELFRYLAENRGGLCSPDMADIAWELFGDSGFTTAIARGLAITVPEAKRRLSKKFVFRCSYCSNEVRWRLNFKEKMNYGGDWWYICPECKKNNLEHRLVLVNER